MGNRSPGQTVSSDTLRVGAIQYVSHRYHSLIKPKRCRDQVPQCGWAHVWRPDQAKDHMSEYKPGHEAVISNGQRAMHLQKVNIAVEVSDLAATTSAYFDAAAKVGTSDELNSLIPDLRNFTALIGRLSQSPIETRSHRTLIPAEVWQRGTAELEDLTHLDTEIDTALATVEKGIFDTALLEQLALRLRELSRVFAELGQIELGALVDQRSTVA